MMAAPHTFHPYLVIGTARTLLDCPDPNKLFLNTDLKVWKKKASVYREAEAVQVYNSKGVLIPVDDLGEEVTAGCAVVANVSLNL
jgi:hypothetical protein